MMELGVMVFLCVDYGKTTNSFVLQYLKAFLIPTRVLEDFIDSDFWHGMAWHYFSEF